MSGYVLQSVSGLHDPTTLALVGFLGADGREYIMPALDKAFQAFQDVSGTPGSQTVNADRGRGAFAAATNSVTITNSLVGANSIVLAHLVTTDATLTTLLLVASANGSFTITGNANATGTPVFNWFVVN